MKLVRWTIPALVLLLCLSGCGGTAVPKTADGLEWSEDWVTLGRVVGVDTPEGLTWRESSDTLAPRGMYYAAWSAGEEVPYVNEDGEDARLYDAQLAYLLAGYDDTGKAEEAAAEWLGMAEEQYEVEETATENRGGQEFTVLTYTCASGTNPYARGASAFGTYGNYAISAELTCRESFDGSAREILEDFLDHCHYAA